MKNLKYYQNEIQKIADNLPFDIRESVEYSMMIHSSPNAIDRFDINDAESMFALALWPYVEEFFDSPEFNNDEFYNEILYNSAIWNLSEEVRLSLL